MYEKNRQRLKAIGRYIWAYIPPFRAIEALLREVAGLLLLVVISLGVIILALYFESSVMGTAFETKKDVMQSLKDSGLIGALGNVAVIAALVSFITKGAKEAKKTRYIRLG